MSRFICFLVFVFLALPGWASEVLRKAVAEYPVVVYVNKAVRGAWGQRVVVFVEGKEVIRDRVSTGREQYEATHFSTTPKGFFTPTALVEDHVSSKSGVEMPFSIFFNEGIALHQAVNQGNWMLGKRASAGCVRLSRELAPRLFDLVESYGKGGVPEISEEGEVLLSSDGNFVRRNRYMTLIVIDDSIEPKPKLLEMIRAALL